VPIPDFVRELRRHIGTAPLWLPSLQLVVRRADELLLVRRADNGDWSPVTGIVDPGEEPAVAARREVLEETGVEVQVERLASIGALPPTVHVNGDRATYLDHTFACRYLGGSAHVADDESSEVRWFAVDDLPPMDPSLRDRVDCVLAGDPVTRFVS